jgi:hypothetical protein
MARATIIGWVGAALLAGGCTGDIGDAERPAETAPPADALGVVGMRRLTVGEIDNALRDLLGDTTRPAAAFLPEDSKTPFDNDTARQVPSAALVDGLEALTQDVTESLLADPARRDEVVGCVPSGADDAACMEQFVRSFGRRALRRPLYDDEVAEYVGLKSFAIEEGDFYVGVETAIWAFLQDPAFLYRVEIGTDAGGPVVRLDSYEVVTRLSFLIWGTIPDVALLDAAEVAERAGASLTAADARDLAVAMLEDPRAREQMQRFHALWLGYSTLPHDPALAEDMQRETAALVDRIVFDDKLPYKDILTLGETFLTPALAQHYGLPAPASAEGAWVSLEGSGRAGLLSHGTFLSNGGESGDTSPTQRGLAVRLRLLCNPPPAPPGNVNVDDPPAGNGPCKWDQLSAYREPGCVGCHQQIDPIGWGLEGYDGEGRFRATDSAGCELEPYTQGQVSELGAFRGPAELGALLATSTEVDACIVTQMYRFVMGKSETSDADATSIDAWRAEVPGSFRMDELLLAFVGHQNFVFRNRGE